MAVVGVVVQSPSLDAYLAAADSGLLSGCWASSLMMSGDGQTTSKSMGKGVGMKTGSGWGRRGEGGCVDGVWPALPSYIRIGTSGKAAREAARQGTWPWALRRRRRVSVLVTPTCWLTGRSLGWPDGWMAGPVLYCLARIVCWDGLGWEGQGRVGIGNYLLFTCLRFHLHFEHKPGIGSAD